MFNNSTNNFILERVKDKPIYFITSLVLGLLGAIFSILGILLLVPLVLTALVNTDLIAIASFTPLLRSLFVFGDRLNQNYSLILLLCPIALIFFLEKIVVYLHSILNLRYSKYLIYELKCQGLLQLSEINFSYYIQNKTGDILFKINREIDKAALAIASIQQVIVTGINILIFISVAVAISVPLSLISLFLVGSIFALDFIYHQAIEKQQLYSTQKTKIYNRQLIDFLLGIHQIKNLATESREYQQITKSIEDKHQAELNSQKNSILVYFLNKTYPMAIAFVLAICSYYLSGEQPEISIPLIIVYLACLSKILLSVTQLKNARARFIDNQSGLGIVIKFLAETNQPKLKFGELTIDNIDNNISFHNITFAYPNHARIILDKINLVIPSKKTTVIIGSTGAGKSTLLSLLLRLYEPLEGKITIDNRDIKQYDLSNLRRSIVTIASEPFIFTNSILYNLTYGLENISEERAIEVAKITKAYDFIIRLPQGFDTVVGKSQIVLSELQKQLLVITRALLLQPQIIIIDRPYKDLDSNESLIIESALTKLCRNRTTISISDRPSSIQKADKIVILNKGRIVESGSHTELLKTSNFYQRICSARFKNSQQSHQQKLAKKISKKLARQNNNLSYQIRNNLNSLLNYLQLINDGMIDDDLEQSRILDESYQSAKNMLTSLREYERKISKGFKKDN